MPNTNNMTSQYTRTYTTFSGADIIATFNNIVIGELQALTFSVTREKAPVYTMGSPDPRSFSRGKRGIAGSLVFSVFDRDCLAELKKQSLITTPYANRTKFPNVITMTDWNLAENNNIINNQDPYAQAESLYADEIPPFDITINFANEYGQRAIQRIYGVELLNEGVGLSIDDITTERAFTFVARALGNLTSQTQN